MIAMTKTIIPKYAVNDRLAFRKRGNPETLPVIVTVFELCPVGDLMRYVVCRPAALPAGTPRRFHAWESELMPLDHMAVRRLEPGQYVINYGANNYNVWRTQRIDGYGHRRNRWITSMQNGPLQWAESDTLAAAKQIIEKYGK